MNQAPEYLRTQSRSLHAMYRRNWQRACWFALLWSLAFGGMFIAAVVDVLANLGWGFTTDDIWNSLLFVLGGAGILLITKLIHSILLASVRHNYGPEPGED